MKVWIVLYSYVICIKCKLYRADLVPCIKCAPGATTLRASCFGRHGVRYSPHMQKIRKL